MVNTTIYFIIFYITVAGTWCFVEIPLNNHYSTLGSRFVRSVRCVLYFYKNMASTYIIIIIISLTGKPLRRVCRYFVYFFQIHLNYYYSTCRQLLSRSREVYCVLCIVCIVYGVLCIFLIKYVSIIIIMSKFYVSQLYLI